MSHGDGIAREVQFYEAGPNTPSELTPNAFAQLYLGQVLLATPQAASHFGFRWFLPALLCPAIVLDRRAQSFARKALRWRAKEAGTGQGSPPI